MFSAEQILCLCAYIRPAWHEASINDRKQQIEPARLQVWEDPTEAKFNF